MKTDLVYLFNKMNEKKAEVLVYNYDNELEAKFTYGGYYTLIFKSSN